MKVCIPAAEDRGLQSEPYNHFGSAPYLVICDLVSGAIRTLKNGDLGHEHGKCLPTVALHGEQVDAVIVGGLGARARERLGALGIRVYRAIPGSLRDNIEALRRGLLAEFTAEETCRHGHEHSSR